MESQNDEDVSGVQLRRHNCPGDHSPRPDDAGGGGGVWKLPSRMCAVRRPGTTVTMPSSHRNAVFVAHGDDRLTVSAGDFSPAGQSPATPHGGDDSDNDGLDYEFVDSDSDDEDVYANMVSDDD